MKRVFTSLCLLLVMHQMQAQTIPAPFDLSTGNYTLTEWADTNAAGTYPPNMVFHITSNSSDTLGFNATGNWICAYNLSARSRIMGRNLDGIGFRRAGNSWDDNCSNATSVQRHPGAAVLSLNSAGRENIQVSWLGKMFGGVSGSGIADLAFDSASQNRVYGIKLQYRTDTTLSFVDVPGAGFYSSLDSINTYKLIGQIDTIPTVTLPFECNNQPMLQVRWVYYRMSGSAGQRLELAIDDINITSSIFTGIKNNIATKDLSIYPNPSVDRVLNINKNITANVYNTIGSLILYVSNSNKIDLSNQPSGIYFVRTNKGEVEKIILK